MIKVAALTSGKHVPSARFRIRQHILPLKRAGIHVREFLPAVDRYAPPPPFLSFSNKIGAIPAKIGWKFVKALATIPGVMGSHTADITWLERELHPGIRILEPFLNRPVVLDVDDAIWLTAPFGRSAAIAAAGMADIVIAGNRYIAEWFGPYAKDVRVVPTAVDTDRIKPPNFQIMKPDSERFVVGWIGTSSNYTYLYQIEKGLSEFLKHHDAELLVMADKAPEFSALGSENVHYVKWDPLKEIVLLGQMDVGLMPLSMDEWSLGKCSFKMLQYMAAGLPVVVSPVGMNVEVLSLGEVGFSAVTPGDWYEALSSLYHNRLLRGYGAEGRRIVEKHFSRRAVSRILADIFRELS